MAVAFCGAEGEGEDVSTGMSPLLRHCWGKEQFEVSGFSVDLSDFRDAVQLVVSALPPTDHQFKGVFGAEELAQAGFGRSVAFPNRLKIIKRALSGDKAMIATLKADGSDLNLEIKVPDFEAEYKLPLKREQLSESEVLSAKLKKVESQLAESQLRIALMKQTFESMRDEIRNRDEHIADLKLKESQLFPTAAPGTDTSVPPRVDFRFDANFKIFETKPWRFRVSSDGKTATEKKDLEMSQLLLKPAVASGTKHTIVFRVEELGQGVSLGVTDHLRETMESNGCEFFSDGDVYVRGETVAESSPFNDLKKGDEIKFTVDLFNGTVSIEVPNGQYTAHWEPRYGRRSWIGFTSLGGGASLSIV